MIDPVSGVGGRLAAGAVSRASSVQAADGGGFGAALAQYATDAVQTLKTAEQTSVSGLSGKVSAQKVVESVMAAEQTLQTAVAIRDKVVNAYLELTRMAI